MSEPENDPDQESEEPSPLELEIETSIVERLAVAFDPLPVEALPPEEYHFTHPDGAVLVMLTDLDPDETVDTFIVAQPVTLSYEVMLLSRSLRDATGLYPMLRAAKRALLGWKPPEASKPLRLKKGRVRSGQDGEWCLSLMVVTEVMYVADIEPDIGPLLKQVTFDEE